jgi:putative membrane protein
MRLIHWVLFPSVTAAAVLFAVSNRQQTEVHLWPLPFVIDFPVYLIALGPLIVGFLIGAVAMWYSSLRRRMRRRAREKCAAREKTATTTLPDKPADAGS